MVFSAYKDVTINMDWNTNAMGSAVTGTTKPVTQVMPSALQVLTWAFATGECGKELWGGVNPVALVNANVQTMLSAGKKYIISTGGAAGVFTCSSDAGFASFIQRYNSAGMLGVDFDIEGGQSQGDINNLVQRVKVARAAYPNMRFSFTLATMAAANQQNLNSLGQWVLQALSAANMGWNNIFINLMVMDYGSASSSACAVGTNGRCDMAQSAINAAESLHSLQGVPYSSIELTPMIGGNDVQEEVFSLANAQTLSAYAKSKGLGGVHFWSFDRDTDCPPGSASSTCNSYGSAGNLGFTNTFLQALSA